MSCAGGAFRECMLVECVSVKQAGSTACDLGGLFTEPLVEACAHTRSPPSYPRMHAVFCASSGSCCTHTLTTRCTQIPPLWRVPRNLPTFTRACMLCVTCSHVTRVASIPGPGTLVLERPLPFNISTDATPRLYRFEVGRGWKHMGGGQGGGAYTRHIQEVHTRGEEEACAP
jgi:hypothetical protein